MDSASGLYQASGHRSSSFWSLSTVKFLYTVSLIHQSFQLCPADGCQIDKDLPGWKHRIQITDPLPASQRQAYETFLAQADINGGY